MEKISSLANMSPVYDVDTKMKRHTTEQINEDMDKMFETEGTCEDFSLSHLNAPDTVSAPWSPGYDENLQVCEADDLRVRDSDIKFHRSDTFPHVHHPLRPHHHRRGSRKSSQSEDTQPSYSRLEKQEENEEEETKAAKGVSFQVGEPEVAEELLTGKEADVSSPPKPTLRKNFSSGLSSDDEEDAPLLSDDSQLRSCIRPVEYDFPYIDESSRKKNRVQFEIGEDEAQPDLEHRTRRRRSNKGRRRDTVEDPAWRRHAGSEHNLQSYTAPTTEDEARNLIGHDLDDMTSHRFDDPSAYRRPRVRARSSVASIIHAGERDDKPDRQMPFLKKTFDHSPHEVFVELDELKYSEGRIEWKETARWIKYEEDVEDVDNRWGKPHLAFLNFHALFSLRKGLEAGKNKAV